MSLFNSVVPPSDANNTAENIADIAYTTKAIRDVISDTTVLPVGTPSDYINYLNKLGVMPTVSADNLDGYLQLLQRDGNATSLADLNATSQGLLDNMNKLAQRADDNNASSSPALTQADYQASGLTTDQTHNVILYNDYLDSAEINSSSVNTTAKLLELTSAVDDLKSNAILSDTEFATLGLSNDMDLSNTYHLNLLNDVLVQDNNKTSAHLHELAKAVKIVQDVADGTTSLPLSSSTIPTRTQMLTALATLGITGVDDVALDDFLTSLGDAGASGADTLSEIQSFAKPAPLPGNLTITDANMTTVITSIYDASTGTAIDVNGTIDHNITISIPYTVTTNDVNLSEYNSSVKTIAISDTNNSEANVKVYVHWDAQTLGVGNGTFLGAIVVDDSQGNNDGIYEAKRLDLNDTNGSIVAAIDYAIDSNGSVGTLVLKIVSAIPDRNYYVQTNGKYEHKFLYLAVTNPDTGKSWLNNNLGAEYADANNPNGNFNPMQQATASDDYKAYGSLFQWGRKADGHELVDWTDGSTGSGKYGATDTNADDPDNSLFITEGNDPYDWRINQDNTLWASESAINNVCPQGYRLPLNINNNNDTDNEFYMETQTWSDQNSTGAINSTLKLPMPGIRSNSDADIYGPGSKAYYYIGTAHGDRARNLNFNTTSVSPNNDSYKSYGMSVRCIKK